MNNRFGLVRAVFAAAVLLFAATFAAADAGERTDLFVAGEGGYAVYRIPGIVTTGRGTLLVDCEARKTPGDWSRIDVLLRRSTDGGTTWGPPRLIAEPPAGARKNPAALAHRQGRPDRAAPRRAPRACGPARGAGARG